MNTSVGSSLLKLPGFTSDVLKISYQNALKKTNELGLCDMGGNVLEWCSDRYSKYYYTQSPHTNPEGPSSGTWKILRGCNWPYDPVRTSVYF